MQALKRAVDGAGGVATAALACGKAPRAEYAGETNLAKKITSRTLSKPSMPGSGNETPVNPGSVAQPPRMFSMPPCWLMATAQRIVAITSDSGDQGLIALAACQAFAQDVAMLK